jgi:hypothetical protein
LAAVEPCTYRIDADDRIRHVGEGWVAFAHENHGHGEERVLPPAVIGQPLLSCIADATTRRIYHDILARLRQGAGPTRFRFRCDSPGMRRLMEMHIAVLEDGSVSFTTSVVRLEPRDPVALLDPAVPRTDELVTSCAWCARVRTPVGEWRPVEEAVRIMDLFERESLPRLTHGICESCAAAMQREVSGDAPPDAITTLGGLVRG